MKIEEIITEVDDLAPNQYSVEQKISWLSSLDGKIFEEVIVTHKTKNPYAYVPPQGYKTDSEQLLLGGPYGKDVYVHYLLAKIASMNGESVKYQQYMALYNTEYGQWLNWYNRRHMPRQSAVWRY